MTYSIKVIDPTTGKTQETTIKASTIEELEKVIKDSYSKCIVEVLIFGRK